MGPEHVLPARGPAGTPHLKPWYYEDGVLRVSPEGEVLAEISVLKALAATYPGLLSVNYEDHLEVDADDPLHLNGVEPLPAAWADRFPGLAAGDLLVSLRSINTVAVIDPSDGPGEVGALGPFAKQHDPDWLPDGRIRCSTTAAAIRPAASARCWSSTSRPRPSPGATTAAAGPGCAPSCAACSSPCPTATC